MIRILSVLVFIGSFSWLGCDRSEDRPNATPTATAVVLPTQAASPTPTTPARAQEITKTWSTKFEFATRSIERKHTGIRSYEISVHYPQIKQAQKPATRKFNRWIRLKVQGYVSQFKRLQKNAEIHDRRRKLPPISISEGLRISYKVYYAGSRLISLRLTHSVMAIGQMHPIDYYETINYDLRRGAPLRQRDLFKRGYLKAFSTYSRQYLKDNYQKDYTTDDWLKKGTNPRVTNFPNWNIVPDGILIAFEDYQIGPHSFGQLELIVPYSELKPVLRKTEMTGSFY